MGRRKPSYLSLMDLFCGAGGASIGAEAAGCNLVIGINHWPTAIETHSLNFPHADHDCRNVSDTHPSRYPSTHLLWASPECPTWSQARGKRRNFTGQLGLTEDDEPLPTEAEERSRVTMWDVVRYAEFHQPEAVVVENVVDVMPWSLLDVWYLAMEKLGYEHRTLFFNSMFVGTPQSRDRWYVVFWKRGNRRPELELTPESWCPRCEATVEGRQSFKKPTRWTDRYGTQYLYLCPRCAGQVLPLVVPALAAIDLGVRGERIGDRKKPLAAATRARIEAGIHRYWTRPGVFDVQRDPKLRDATTAPLPTQTGRQSLALYLPMVARFRGTSASHLEGSTRSSSDPLGTISAGGLHHGVVNPPLYVKNMGGVDRAGPQAHPVTDPLGTLTAAGNTALVVGIERGYHGREHQHVRAADDVLTTLMGKQDRALLTPAGGTWRQEATSAIAPMPARTAGDNDAVVAPPMLELQAAGNTYDGASGAGNDYVRIRPADGHPLWTQPGRAQTGIAQAPDAFVSAYYRSAVNREVAEPMPTFRANESHALIEGPAIAVEDCYFRMLMPREIGLGMAFPDDYKVAGRQQRWVVRQYGLAVTPPVAAWIWQRVIESLR